MERATSPRPWPLTLVSWIHTALLNWLGEDINNLVCDKVSDHECATVDACLYERFTTSPVAEHNCR